ncbi:MAG TPA: leucine-rich repeat domain-containing protein [Verrucomicrobiae bacterium]|nr:leucine-rich repeat domain-containing protein [Verrucomicrobiae bacterium]
MITGALRLGFIALAIAKTLPAFCSAQFLYATNNGALTITGYTGTGGTITVPSSSSGLPVTEIASFAFRAVTNLTAVTISEGITNVGFEAFANCTALQSVQLPKSTSSIGNWAFQGCTNLATINVTPANANYSSSSGVLFNAAQTQLIAYPAGKKGSYAIPATVTNIELGAFGGCAALTAISIPPSVLSISDSAFYSCTGLRAVSIPGNVQNIGTSAFFSCTNLVTAIIGDSVTNLQDYAFASCFNLVDVQLGSNVSTIGYGVFSYSGLTNLYLPASLTQMGDAAFEDCSNLASVVSGPNLIAIPNFAFDACAALTNVRLSSNIATFGVNAFSRCADLKTVTIPKAVTNVSNAAFMNCSNLASIYFLSSPPRIGAGIFSGDINATVYYDPLASGWTNSFAGLPAIAWNATPSANVSGLGVGLGGFQFPIAGNSNLSFVVEATTTLNNPTWAPIGTNTTSSGIIYFSDPNWTRTPTRFYRLRSP